jgi:hypothetical protein
MIEFKDTPENEKKLIIKLFYDLYNPYSYYSVLQYLYNNNGHFVTVDDSKNICTPEMLNIINKYSNKKNEKLKVIVNGGIHTNNHVSNVLLNEYNQSIFVEDTYIQFQLYPDDITTNKKRHLLVNPPHINNVQSIQNYIYNPNYLCFVQYNTFIAPTYIVNNYS